MSNIPCINCITFAICNAQVGERIPHIDIITNLMPKCSLIRNYTKYYNEYNFSTKLVLKVTKIFKPKAPIKEYKTYSKYGFSLFVEYPKIDLVDLL